MSYKSWVEPAVLLEQQLAPVDQELAELAVKLGIEPAASHVRVLLVARIEDAVSAVTGMRAPRPCTSAQAELLLSLGHHRDDLTVREADALIRVAIVQERLKALGDLQPMRGDVLFFKRGPFPKRAMGPVTVSSIDRFGQVWVERAGGSRMLPQDLTRSTM